MKQFNRSDPDYINSALEQVYAAGGRPLGLQMDRPPENFEELVVAFIDQEDDSEVDRDINQFIDLMAGDPNRDEIARLLPYDSNYPAGVWLVLPDIENVTQMKET